MKKLFLSLMFLGLFCSFADTSFLFRMTDDGKGIYIDKYTGTDSIVYIAPYYNGLPVKGIGASAFRYNKVVVEIQLPETVEWIGSSAFWDMYSLRKINFPASLQSVGYEAFYGCRSLSQIDFSYPIHTLSWSGNAFSACHSLPMNVQLTLIKMGYKDSF